MTRHRWPLTVLLACLAAAIVVATVRHLERAMRRTGGLEPWDETDDMCPNCVTPWKCNGPHVSRWVEPYDGEAIGV